VLSPRLACTIAVRVARRTSDWSLDIRSSGPAITVGEGAPRRSGALGLSICRHLVERHGGRLEIGSAGRHFSFTLPL
jgi:signal transduction histidine kinase